MPLSTFCLWNDLLLGRLVSFNQSQVFSKQRACCIRIPRETEPTGDRQTNRKRGIIREVLTCCLHAGDPGKAQASELGFGGTSLVVSSKAPEPGAPMSKG